MPSVRPRRSFRTRSYRKNHALRPSKLHRSLTDLENQRRRALPSAHNDSRQSVRTRESPRVLEKMEKNKGNSDKTLVRIFREDVASSAFVFSDMQWTTWQTVASSGDDLDNTIWEIRKSGVGKQKVTLYGGDVMRPAIYEFAVRFRDVTDAEMYVMYFRVTMGFQNKASGNLDYLLGSDQVSRQIDALLPTCDVLMRRACYDDVLEYGGKRLWNPTDFKGVLLREYDYAWVPSSRLRWHREIDGSMLCRPNMFL